MTDAINRQSAKIYQFPVGGRAAVALSRDMEKRRTTVKAERPPKVVFGGSWYHEAAIEEAARARARDRD
jgi:hypothetical protein